METQKIVNLLNGSDNDFGNDNDNGSDKIGNKKMVLIAKHQVLIQKMIQ